ncbi:hypothetical protein [Stigmatella aurantiaca]|uniref:Uncharacterized protein n=1 Tax=Stigmatella aurantiaca (strain DW4/3-1) TaxID=378806 RepID=E3FST5_STIAD|nr:hypothetical protein [Stigmatella aurantiaca]ADO74559.1 uncharacterized protein STAUR_6802 [Stigmatella aurantiaca DW4/3-1]
MRKKARKKELSAYYEDEGLHGGTLALAHGQARGLLEVGQGVRHRGVNRMADMMHRVRPRINPMPQTESEVGGFPCNSQAMTLLATP